MVAQRAAQRAVAHTGRGSERCCREYKYRAWIFTIFADFLTCFVNNLPGARIVFRLIFEQEKGQACERFEAESKVFLLRCDASFPPGRTGLLQIVSLSRCFKLSGALLTAFAKRSSACSDKKRQFRAPVRSWLSRHTKLPPCHFATLVASVTQERPAP